MRVRPSYHQGYARSANESVYSNSWRGLVGDWVPALGPTGVTLRDVSGHHRHGTLIDGDPARDWIIGNNSRMPGYVLNMEQAGSPYVDLSATAGAMLQSVPGVTMLVWVNFDTITSATSIVQSDWMLAVSAGSSAFGSRATLGAFKSDEITIGGRSADSDSFRTGETTTAPLVIGQWAQLGGVLNYPDDSMSIFVNGQLEASFAAVGFSQSTSDSSLSDNIAIGADDDGATDHMNGKLGRIQVYGRVLTHAEIALEYAVSLASLQKRRRVFGFAAAPVVPSMDSWIREIDQPLPPRPAMVVSGTISGTSVS